MKFEYQKNIVEMYNLTGLFRSGSRKTTRRICSTATWSLCSSNCRKNHSFCEQSHT